MRRTTFLWCCIIGILMMTGLATAQDQAILVPKTTRWTPYAVDDQADLFGKAWRFYREGFTNWAADSLRKLIDKTGFVINPHNYYIVVANFTPTETAIGMFHGDAGFNDTRLYGLTSDSLYYVFISRDDSSSSYLSAMVTRKDSYFEQVLPYFISLFPFLSQVQAVPKTENLTWVDVRKFEIPKKFKKNCDISIIVKRKFYDDHILARAIFDNTSLEQWSYGIATAVTNVNDVDYWLDGNTIVVRPKPRGDLATFGVVNYHLKPVDTKAPTLASSFHLLGGFRISRTIEPIIGAGFGIPIRLIDLHLFAGFSLEFAQELKPGYKIGQELTSNVDPFQLKLRGRLRYGLEVRFP